MLGVRHKPVTASDVKAGQIRVPPSATKQRGAALLRCNGGGPGSNSDTIQWLAWARAHVSELDPLTTSPVMPGQPEIRLDGLQPYLPPWITPTGIPSATAEGRGLRTTRFPQRRPQEQTHSKLVRNWYDGQSQ